MDIEIQLTRSPIAEKINPPRATGTHGAWLEFRGVVRGEENGQAISALEYEAYPEMAEREIRRILASLSAKHSCLTAKVIHRIGVIPTGETAIYVGVASPHRGESLALLTEFMNRLKQDVPIWKAGSLPLAEPGQGGAVSKIQVQQSSANKPTKPLSFDQAIEAIQSRVQPLPAIRAPLSEIFGLTLREDVRAPEDFPAHDRSTRDGYAVLQNDFSEIFQIVDTLHAADWRPRQLKIGEAVRIATGAALPCENLQVAMQEDVERNGDKIKIIRRESATNIRKQGEEVRAGEMVLPAGTGLNAGALAVLAAMGCTQPLVSPRLRAVHFTTGDEVIPPEQTPRPGQIRDSNSILIRSLFQKFPCGLVQAHLAENFDAAKSEVQNYRSQVDDANVLLISGGASVGEKDFTRDLLAHLGFEMVFSRLNIRPGAPLIFGVNGSRVAFGLPGNPMAHFVCFHLLVSAALNKCVGAALSKFTRGTLTSKLDDEPCPRETLLPARVHLTELYPLKWMSSGDITCLAQTNALIRVPANTGLMEAGAEVDFLPV
jgi:molybdopterin molybdotransferase